MNKINSDSSEQKYFHLSNGLIQSYEIVTWLKYEYAQVTVDLFYENVPLHLSIIWLWFAFTFRQFSCILKCVL